MNNTGASVSYSPVFQVPLGPLNIMPYGERILFAGLYPRSGNCYTSTLDPDALGGEPLPADALASLLASLPPPASWGVLPDGSLSTAAPPAAAALADCVVPLPPLEPSAAGRARSFGALIMSKMVPRALPVYNSSSALRTYRRVRL